MSKWLILLVGLLLFFRLGNTTLNNWDEAWFAAVARSMVERGDYLVGYWNGEPWFYEPPLVTWTLALLMRVGLTSEFWLRLPVALSGVGVVWLTYKLATFIQHSMKVKQKNLVGLMAALVLLSNIEFLFRARQINVYVPLTFFLLLAFYAAYRSLRSQSRRWIILALVAFGMSFLTARVTALLALPALVAVLWPKLMKKESRRWFLLAVLLGIAVFGWWYAAVYWRYGVTFLQKYFLGYTLTKVATTNPEVGMDWLFYLQAVKRAFKLWIVVVPVAFFWALGQLKQQKQQVWLGLLIYLISFLVSLTVIPNKASWFLLPAYPVMAIAVGAWLNSLKGTVLKRTNLIRLVLVTLASGVFLFQMVYWKDQYVVPQTTAHQARMAQKAKAFTSPSETIYLDDDYLPVAVFYSQRQMRPLRFNRIIDESWGSVTLPSGSYVLSNLETVENLRKRSLLPLTQIEQQADLLLLRVEENSR